MPLVIRTIRAEMRRHRAGDLSVPQFRALAYLGSEAGASLSEVARHVGLALPSMSKMIDGLVARGLVRRRPSPRDRRRITLTLSARGGAVLRVARARAQARVALRLGALSGAERLAVCRAMRALRTVFEPPRGCDPERSR